jgi:hypothetical protein
MARLVIELTNRCNLRCQHCFAERHAATGELPLAILETVLREGKGCGITHLALTGGEPTLHRQFAEILRRVCAAEYPLSPVSNGTNFPRIYPLLRRARPWCTGITFYYSLNATGTCIWQGLKQGLSLREICERLQGKFTVKAERAGRGVLTFVNELLQHQLVQRHDG